MAVRKNCKLFNVNILNVPLKHIIWRFRICNYFREMFKFSDFMNTLRNFPESVLLVFLQNLHTLRNNLYQRNLQITCLYVHILKVWNFFEQPFWSLCGVISLKLLINSRHQNIFLKFNLKRNLQRIPFKMMWNMSMLRHRFSNERWVPWTTFLFYSVKVCNKFMVVWESLETTPHHTTPHHTTPHHTTPHHTTPHFSKRPGWC